MNTPIESFKVDEGTDAYGVNTQVIFEGNQIVKKRSFDANPILEACKAERLATEGQRWGEMRKVGTIPMAKYVEFMAIPDQNERKKKVKSWLLQNEGFITFEKYAR
jgi:hypothetical protein